MAGLQDLLDRIRLRRMRHYWRRRARTAAEMDARTLKTTHTAGLQLRDSIDAAIKTSSDALRKSEDEGVAIHLPSRADWSYRPGAWLDLMSPQGHAPLRSGTQLNRGVALYHDCDLGRISLRQLPQTRASSLPPYCLDLDVLTFSGTYLSLVAELPKDAVSDFTQNDLLRVQIDLEMETNEDVFVRLNVKNGPNTEQISRHLDLSAKSLWVEFDLHYTNIEFHLITDIWIDLIFEKPAMNRIILNDLTCVRRPRASV